MTGFFLQEWEMLSCECGQFCKGTAQLKKHRRSPRRIQQGSVCLTELLKQLAGTATYTAESHGEHGKAPACTTPWDNATSTGTKILHVYKLPPVSMLLGTSQPLDWLQRKKKTCSPNFALLCGSDEGGKCLCSSCTTTWHVPAKPACLHFWRQLQNKRSLSSLKVPWYKKKNKKKILK